MLPTVPFVTLSPSLIGSLALFVFAMSITPGPNNVMLTASGLNFGFRRSVPHMLGISSGVMLMTVCVGLGMGAVFTTWPVLYTVLKYVGALYLLYLAWAIAHAGGAANTDAPGRPFTFLQAATFQWVNPKAWIMVVGAIATYTPQQGFLANLVLVTLSFGIVGLPCIAVWAYAGSALRRVLRTPRAIRLFNTLMALLLLASLYPVLRDLLLP